jgi:aquaporin Z|uniref:Major intrinsic protein n=1 Tax=viral metagenome TaxID=1070528 RepID=A0A6C0C1V1_9ZZZZ|tara:strand:- start:305 stop:571 length:267 start_codon:yes stop_codon:yes gene_type:complete
MNKYLVEFLGTCLFLYVILATGSPIPIGLALMLVIVLGGKISGGHYNPAVSVMMAVGGRMRMSELAPYVLAQVAGGVAALELHKRVRF